MNYSRKNTHYYNRYIRFIETIQQQKDRELPGYTETHHIIPKCQGGDNSAGNLIKLTLREHFLAHWLLWKAFPKHLGTSSAFLQMVKKNPKVKKEFQGRVTSRVYEQLKTETYNMLRERRTGKVFVKNQTGNVVELTKAEYQNQKHLLPFHTTGKVYVLNKKTNSWEYVSSAYYQENKDTYVSRTAYRPGTKYQFENRETGETIRASKAHAKELNAAAGRKVYFQKFNQVIKVKCKEGLIPISQYDSSIHTHVLRDTFVVLDLTDQVVKSISKHEYDKDPARYQTSTKGKVLAKDKLGKTVLVSKDEFNSGDFVGQTAGLCTVFNSETKKFEQISTSEFNSNRKQYQGPCTGKINIINKETGIRGQINKSEFDPSVHLALGNTKYLFRCQNILTGKEKYINIYEWRLVHAQFKILDLEKFTKLKHLL